MDGKEETQRFLERAMAEDMDSLEIVEAVMAFEESLDDDPEAAEPDALVCAPLRPGPHLDSGGISLPEPDDRYDMV